MTNQLTVTAPAGTPFIDFEREFDAPVAAVFEAHRDPDLFRKWIGPDEGEVEIESYDFRTGGAYRYVHRDENGSYGFHGVFHTVRENEFAVQTFEFEGWPDHVSLDTLTFVDLGDGRCKLVGHGVLESVEARDGMVASGMEGGMSEGYAKLDRLLAGTAA